MALLRSALIVAIAALLPRPGLGQGTALQAFDTIYTIDGHEAVLEEVPLILPAPDGSIVVPQTFSRMLRRFSPDGQELEELGRPGSGPGEFSAINVVGWKADSLWAFDGPQNRYTLFGNRGEGAVNTFRSRGAKAPPGSSLPSSALVSPQVLQEDGSVIGKFVIPSWPDGKGRRTQPVALIDPEGTVIRLVTTLPGDKGEWFEEGQYRGWAADPFEYEWFTAASPGGEWYVVASPSESVEDGFFLIQVLVFDPAGDLTRSHELRVRGIKVSRAEKRRIFERRARLHPPSAWNAAIESMEQSSNDHYPPILAMSVDSEGVVWIQYRASVGMTRLTSVNPEGDEQSYDIPIEFTFRAAEADRIWLVSRDQYDVTSILALRVFK